jgi:regulator of cell morphogenesis and NO signaling
MLIHANKRVKEIASAGESARVLLEHSGVDFCCEGNASLREACARAGADAADLERRLSVLPEAPRTCELAELVDHIVTSVHPRTRTALVEARAESAKLGLGALGSALTELARVADERMREDEQVLRHVRALAEARAGRGPFPDGPFTTVHTTEHRIREGHARLHDALRKVRHLAHESAVPLPAIDELKSALVDQMHIVNNELLPYARDLEPG